ncbi:unnamed protein product [Cochlearia groenlandica]
MSTTTSLHDQEHTEIGASGSGNNNNNNYFNTVMREHMFDKVLTPSDVGKLNRLVIPKQHAENFFPLEENQNGTVLEFQDRNGKMWRFRYSYWTSSQSYVMTKGWSRFVKDKKLEAADTVSFHRGYITDNDQEEEEEEEEGEKQRKIMFIDWRHRANIINNINDHHHHYPIFGFSTYPSSSANYYPVHPYRSIEPTRTFHHNYNNQFQERELLGYGSRIINGGRYYAGSPLDHNQWNHIGRSEPLIYESYPVYPAARVSSSSSSMMLPPSFPSHHQMAPPEGNATKKLIRLFGVDVEESSSSGETRGDNLGASSSSVMELSDDDDYRRKEKSSY